MNYRQRIQNARLKAQAHNREGREDKILFAEPHLRDYEAAYFEAKGISAKTIYRAGWVEISTPGVLAKVRLNALIHMTAMLHAEVASRSITNEGADE